jgi:hypothetical protein
MPRTVVAACAAGIRAIDSPLADYKGLSLMRLNCNKLFRCYKNKLGFSSFLVDHQYKKYGKQAVKKQIEFARLALYGLIKGMQQSHSIPWHRSIVRIFGEKSARETKERIFLNPTLC